MAIPSWWWPVACRRWWRTSSEAGATWERDLNVRRIGNLEPTDARAAITTPIARSDIRFSEALTDRIVDESRGYPYFIQYFCSFLIDSVPDQRAFDLDAFEELRPMLIAQLDQSFFDGRFSKLPHAEQEALIATARAGEQVRLRDVTSTGSRDVFRVAISRLVERGHLYRPSARAEVAFALPLYRDFLLRVAERRNDS